MKKQLLAPLMAVFFFAVAMKSEAQWNLTGNANATATSILGTTNAIPLNLTTNNVQRLVIDASGKVGIGIAAPPNVFSVKGSGGVPNSVWTNAGAPLFTGFGEQTVGNADYILSIASSLANARPVFIGRRARGTLAAPAVVSNNDQIMSFLSSGFDGTGFQNPAAIDFFVDGTPTAGNVPARISFVTGTNGATRAERLKIGSTGDITVNTNQLFVQSSGGNVGLGTTTPLQRLHVAGSSLTTVNALVNGAVVIDASNANDGTLATGGSLRFGNAATGESIISKRTIGGNQFGIDFLTGAASRLSIANNGNVGIGTTAPIAKLDVAGNVKIADGTQGAGKVLTSDASGLSSWQAVPTSTETDPKVGNLSANKIPKWNGSTLADGSITDNGNVGIGEANPQGILHVSQPGVFSGVAFAGTGINDLTPNTSGYTGTGTTTYVIKINNAGPDPNLIQVSTNGGSSFGFSFPIANPINLAFGVTATFGATGGHTFGDQWTFSITKGFNDVLFADSGRVGINTKSPTTTLDVVGGDARINGLTVGRGRGLISSNTAVGFQALDSNTTGRENLANGAFAMLNNTIGNFNTANGVRALFSNTSGSENTANGIQSLFLNTTGFNNTASGSVALAANTTGSNNTANGRGALQGNTTGNDNTANGAAALNFNTTGFSNVAVGTRALRSNTTGSNLVAIGDSALLRQNGGNGLNTAVGSKALLANTTGGSNTANGYQSLFSNTTGSSNVAVGNSALRSNITGSDLVAIGDSTLLNQNGGDGFNTAVGSKALFANTTGANNTANGSNALRSNTIGNANIAMGVAALFSNTSRSNQIAIGDSALFNLNGGNFNTAIGTKSLFSDTTGNENTGVGFKTLFNTTSGSFNSAFGTSALLNNTTGSSNIAIGTNSLLNNTTGNSNSAVGKSALQSNTTGISNTATGLAALFSNTTGIDNAAVGRSALESNTTGNTNTAIGGSALLLNTTGISNVAIGTNALRGNTTTSNLVAIGDSALFNQNGGAGFNTAVGSKALLGNTTGGSNTANGYQSLFSNTTGSSNVAMGSNTLRSNATGSNLVAVGDSALLVNNTGNGNVGIGKYAMRKNTSGNQNVAVGDSALSNCSTGGDNTAVGSKSNPNVGGSSNTTAIGANTVITGANMVRFGASTVTSIGGFANFTNISDGRFKTKVEANVPGIEFISKLRPVTYHLDVTGIDQFTNIHYRTAEQLKARSEKEQITYTGFIAQEVEAAAKSINFNFSGVDAPKNDKDMYGLRYAEFVVPLVKAVQELSTENNELKKAKAEQETRIAKLETMMQQLLNSKSAAPCPPLAGQ